MHIISANSIFGMPMQVFGKLLIGFMVFGIVMKVQAAEIFLNLSLCAARQISGVGRPKSPACPADC